MNINIDFESSLLTDEENQKLIADVMYSTLSHMEEQGAIKRAKFEWTP